MIIPEIKMSEAIKGKTFAYYLNKVKKYPIIAINTSSLFNGNLDMLKKARKKYPKKLIIRKDFIMIPRQIDESKKAGADYVLLLSEYLTQDQLNELIAYCSLNNINYAIELNSYKEIALFSGDTIIVNSRNLNTGKINRGKAINICREYKQNGLYNISVIFASGEKTNYIPFNKIADFVLIGTAFMKEKLK